MRECKDAFNSFVRGMRGSPFAVRYWDGTETLANSDGASPQFTLRIKDEHVLKAILKNPSLGFGESFTDGELEVEGSLETCLTTAATTDWSHVHIGLGDALRLTLERLRPIDAIGQSRRNAEQHYNLENEFYRLWLDERMQYTCAYFHHPGESLEQAQVNKLDHVCRKLRLQPGERVLETGSGWGGFAIYAAQQYGVFVRAFNVASEQVRYARAWAEREGLSDRVEFVDDDYRNATGMYDKFASIGMLEHVGVANYDAFGRLIRERLRPEGFGVIHFIGHSAPMQTDPWIGTRVFPGGYMPTLHEVTPLFEENGLMIEDVEYLRLHYGRTLEHWRDRYEAHQTEIEAMFDERLYRKYRLYITGSIVSFKTGATTLYQITFTNGPTNRLPLTRKHLHLERESALAEPTWNGMT